MPTKPKKNIEGRSNFLNIQEIIFFINLTYSFLTLDIKNIDLYREYLLTYCMPGLKCISLNLLS